MFDFKVGGTYRAPKLRPDLQTTTARAGMSALTENALKRWLGNVPLPGGAGTATSPPASIPPTGRDAVQDAGKQIQKGLRDLLRGRKAVPADTAHATRPHPDSTRKP